MADETASSRDRTDSSGGPERPGRPERPSSGRLQWTSLVSCLMLGALVLFFLSGVLLGSDDPEVIDVGPILASILAVPLGVALLLCLAGFVERSSVRVATFLSWASILISGGPFVLVAFTLLTAPA